MMKTGRIRLCDDSLASVGIKRGDIAHITLDYDVRDGDLAAVLTGTGYLKVAFYHYHDGAICLRAGGECRGEHYRGGLLFGHVVRVEREGRVVNVGCRLRQASRRRGAKKRARQGRAAIAAINRQWRAELSEAGKEGGA